MSKSTYIYLHKGKIKTYDGKDHCVGCIYRKYADKKKLDEHGVNLKHLNLPYCCYGATHPKGYCIDNDKYTPKKETK